MIRLIVKKNAFKKSLSGQRRIKNMEK